MQTMASPISICSPSSFGNASRSTQLSFQIQLGFQASISSKLPQWATLSNPYSSAFFLNGQRFQIHAASSKFKSTNPISKSTSKLNQFGLQVQVQSQLRYVFFFSQIGESFRSGTSLLKSSQPSNTTTLPAELSNPLKSSQILFPKRRL